MLNERLQGFHILIASDHADLANLFDLIVTACGAKTTKTASVMEAFEALRTRPDAVLLDVALADNAWAVPVEASTLRVPIIALTHRSPDPHEVAGPVRALVASALHTTDLDEVCKALHAAMTEGP